MANRPLSRTGRSVLNDQSALNGQWALVTGSSSGIGRAIALELGSAGANILVHGSRRRAAAEQLAEQLRNLGVQSAALLVDLSATDGRLAIVEQAWQIAAIDIWINCAGTDVLTGKAAQWSFENKLSALWPLDVVATIELSRLVVSTDETARSRRIVEHRLGSGRDRNGGRQRRNVCSDQGAVMAFTRSIAKSLAPEVRVNCIAPGWIKTDWGEAADEYWQQRAVNESLLQRWGTPEDIATAAHFLVSPQASFITGQILHVNGGRR